MDLDTHEENHSASVLVFLWILLASFLPVVGRFHEGKAVYSFNGAFSYIDRGVLFVRIQRSDEVQEESWRPVSLEEAFEVSNDLRRRGKRAQKATEKVRAEPSKNSVFGMPGIKPKRNKTHALGNHACLTPI